MSADTRPFNYLDESTLAGQVRRVLMLSIRLKPRQKKSKKQRNALLCGTVREPEDLAAMWRLEDLRLHGAVA